MTLARLKTRRARFRTSSVTTAAHILSLDEKDPVVIMDQSATGFYGLNDDDDPIADRSSVMVAFDGPLDSRSISTNTFSWRSTRQRRTDH